MGTFICTVCPVNLWVLGNFPVLFSELLSIGLTIEIEAAFKSPFTLPFGAAVLFTKE